MLQSPRSLVLITKGLATYIPGVLALIAKGKTEKKDPAKYCYEVWLKHLTLLWENGMRETPETIAELGPGSSLGVGLAALLSGVNHYYALDVVKHIKAQQAPIVFNELVELFKKRAGRPTKGWPDFDGYLDQNLFPSHILTEEALNVALQTERVESIRKVLSNMDSEYREVIIKYVAPWNDPRVIIPESVDVIISQSVLEHVNNLEETYRH